MSLIEIEFLVKVLIMEYRIRDLGSPNGPQGSPVRDLEMLNYFFSVIYHYDYKYV